MSRVRVESRRFGFVNEVVVAVLAGRQVSEILNGKVAEVEVRRCMASVVFVELV